VRGLFNIQLGHWWRSRVPRSEVLSYFELSHLKRGTWKASSELPLPPGAAGTRCLSEHIARKLFGQGLPLTKKAIKELVPR